MVDLVAERTGELVAAAQQLLVTSWRGPVQLRPGPDPQLGAGSPGRFERELASACAVSMLRQLPRLAEALAGDRVVGHYLIRHRQRLLAVLDAFLTMARSFDPATGPAGGVPPAAGAARRPLGQPPAAAVPDLADLTTHRPAR